MDVQKKSASTKGGASDEKPSDDKISWSLSTDRKRVWKLVVIQIGLLELTFYLLQSSFISFFI